MVVPPSRGSTNTPTPVYLRSLGHRLDPTAQWTSKWTSNPPLSRTSKWTSKKNPRQAWDPKSEGLSKEFRMSSLL
jgi:hypothetical protein